MATHKIVVLSDGTWETASHAILLTITDEAYNKLLDGEIETADLRDGDDILIGKEIS